MSRLRGESAYTHRAEAIKALRPGAEWRLEDDILWWLDPVQVCPTEEEIVAEMAALALAEEAEATRQALLAADSRRQELFGKLKTATPAQISTWIDTNITTLVAARELLKAIVIYLATRL